MSGTRQVLVAGGLAALIASVVVVDVGIVAFRNGERVERAKERRQELADQKFDAALAGPADTAHTRPGPGGTRVYTAPPPGEGAHGYRVTLPRGWEARRVDARENDSSYSDSVLTWPDEGAIVVIDRIDLDAETGSPAFEGAMLAGLTTGDDGLAVDGAMTTTTIGQDEPAFRFEGTVKRDDGVVVRVRVVVFDHVGETFRVDLGAAERSWDTALPQFERILASWRWG